MERVRRQLRQLAARHGIRVEGSFRRQGGAAVAAALVACRVPRSSKGTHQDEQPRQEPPGGPHVVAVGEGLVDAMMWSYRRLALAAAVPLLSTTG